MFLIDPSIMFFGAHKQDGSDTLHLACIHTYIHIYVYINIYCDVPHTEAIKI